MLLLVGKGAAAAQMQQLPPAQLHLIAFRQRAHWLPTWKGCKSVRKISGNIPNSDQIDLIQPLSGFDHYDKQMKQIDTLSLGRATKCHNKRLIACVSGIKVKDVTQYKRKSRTNQKPRTVSRQNQMCSVIIIENSSINSQT